MEECLDENGIEIKPGVFALLDFLKEKKIKRAIATATDTQRTEKYLKNLGLYDYFDGNYLCNDGGAWQTRTGYLSICL